MTEKQQVFVSIFLRLYLSVCLFTSVSLCFFLSAVYLCCLAKFNNSSEAIQVGTTPGGNGEMENETEVGNKVLGRGRCLPKREGERKMKVEVGTGGGT